MPIASGSWVPVGPVQPPAHKQCRWKTKARLHTPKCVKRSQLDPERSPTRTGSADAHSNEDNPVDPSQEDNAGPDLSDQDLPMSPHKDAPDFDWVANTRRPERENPLSPGGPGDDLGPSHTPNPGAGDEDTRQGDDDVPGRNTEPDPGAGDEDNQQGDDNVPGRNAEPNDVPGGPNDRLPDDLVPHLEAL